MYNKEGAIPTQRVKLYGKQVEAIVSRCIAMRIKTGENLSIFCVGELSPDAGALKIATCYLETLAFVCQIRLNERDFTLDTCSQSSKLASHITAQAIQSNGKYIHDMLELWNVTSVPGCAVTPDLISSTGEPLFKAPIVGLLTSVGGDSYRFSHLTLQEFLAAAIFVCMATMRKSCCINCK